MELSLSKLRIARTAKNYAISLESSSKEPPIESHDELIARIEAFEARNIPYKKIIDSYEYVRGDSEVGGPYCGSYNQTESVFEMLERAQSVVTGNIVWPELLNLMVKSYGKETWIRKMARITAFPFFPDTKGKPCDEQVTNICGKKFGENPLMVGNLDDIVMALILGILDCGRPWHEQTSIANTRVRIATADEKYMGELYLTRDGIRKGSESKKAFENTYMAAYCEATS